MSEQLKRRLTGAAVLLLLAGLAWPLLFSFDQDMAGQELQVDVPARPGPVASSEPEARAEPAIEVESPTLTERLSAEAKALLEAADDSLPAELPVAAARDKPRLDGDRIPVSYVVQVATFNEWNNAKNFRQSLLDSGFKAYVKPPSASQPGPYRIAVGPVLTYAEAEQISQRIEQEHRIMDTIIRRLRDV